MDGQLNRLKRESREIYGCRVVADPDEGGDHFGQEDDTLQVCVELEGTREVVWADLVMPGGGPRAGFVRIPSKGATGIALLPKGQRDKARVVGWEARPDAEPRPEANGGGELDREVWYWVAPSGESIEVRADDGGTIRLDVGDGATVVELEDGEATVEAQEVTVKAETINHGSDNPASKPALYDKVEARLQAIEGRLNSHVTNPGPHMAPAIPSGPVSTPPLSPTTQPGETASDKVNSD